MVLTSNSKGKNKRQVLLAAFTICPSAVVQQYIPPLFGNVNQCFLPSAGLQTVLSFLLEDLSEGVPEECISESSP